MVQPQPWRETLRALIARHAQQCAAAPAILAPGRALLSYGALNEQIERSGLLLAGIGLGRGSRIAVSLPDSAETAVTMLTAMSFAACAPLDPHLKLQAAGELLERLHVDALVIAENSDSPTCAAARAMRLQIVRMCPLTSEPAGVFSLRSESARASVEPGSPEPDEVALVMRTSGTTGRPKLVPMTLAQILWSSAQARFAAADRALCLSPLYTRSAFGISVMGMLTAGASTIITAGLDAEAFVDWLDTLRPTFYSASPTVHAAVLDLLKKRRPATPRSLRFIRSSSKSLPARVEAQLEAAFGVPVVQGYGMTETGLIAQNPLPPGRQRAGSAGISTGIEICIRDEHGARVPDGAPGEITVRGPGVMHAYEDDPEANQRAFHGGWFRTGDLGYVDADGCVFLTGRIKELINRGGLKVSPAEVDEALLRHPAVLAAATFSIAARLAGRGRRRGGRASGAGIGEHAGAPRLRRPALGALQRTHDHSGSRAVAYQRPGQGTARHVDSCTWRIACR